MNELHETESLTIRIDYLANHADGIPALAAARYGHWRVIYEQRGISREDLILRIRKHAQSEAMPLAVVALHENRIVGSASILPHDLDPRTTTSVALYARLGWSRFEQMEYCGRTIQLMYRTID